MLDNKLGDKKDARSLSFVLLVGMTFALIAGVTLAPRIATDGPAALTIIVIGAVVTLIPSGLIASELATAWPHDGGVYLWVSEAFGPRSGFMAIWLQWLDQMVFLPTSLAFVAATAAFVFDQSIATNRIYLFAVIVFVIWAATLLNMRGLRE